MNPPKIKDEKYELIRYVNCDHEERHYTKREYVDNNEVKYHITYECKNCGNVGGYKFISSKEAVELGLDLEQLPISKFSKYRYTK